MNRIIHFEIQATDPERLAPFYRNVFGWKIDEWVLPGIEMKDENRYWMVITGSDSDPASTGASYSAMLRHLPVDGQQMHSSA